MKNRTRTSCGIIAVVLIIVFASVYYFVGDGIRVFVSDSPLEPEKPEVPIVQHIPSNASAAWRADDFKSLITSLAPSALGKILLSNDVNLYLFSLLNPDKPKELRDSTLYMAYSIRQLAITVLEGEPILILKLDDEGETHLRKLKELVYESNSLFETQEDGLTWVKRESAQVPRKLFCYRTAGNLLVLGASEEGVRAIYDEPGEEHYRDAFTEADDETIRHIVGSSRIGEGMAYFFNTVGKWGSRWEIRFSEELASDLEVEAISGDMVSHEDAIGVAAGTISLAESLLQMAGLDIESVTRFTGNAVWEKLGGEVGEGTVYYVWHENSLPNDFFLSLPVSGDSDAAAQLTELARAEGLEVKVRKKKVDYYYVSKPGKSIGMSGGKGIRFWCQDGERLQVANSQFSLWNVRKDEQDAKLLEMPASTVGYVYLDLTGGTKFLPLATMAFASLSGSNLPELGPIAERLGEARVFIRREGPELVAEGTSDLPLGFALHLLFGGYNIVDGTKTER